MFSLGIFELNSRIFLLYCRTMLLAITVRDMCLLFGASIYRFQRGQ